MKALKIYTSPKFGIEEAFNTAIDTSGRSLDSSFMSLNQEFFKRNG